MTRSKKLGFSVSAAVFLGAACSSYVDLDTAIGGTKPDCFETHFNAAKAEITSRYQSNSPDREAISRMSDEERMASFIRELEANDRMGDEIHAARISSRHLCDALTPAAR